MATCRMDSIDELLRELEDAADVDEIADEMMTEGAKILQTNTKYAILGAANRGYATGQLMNSVVPDKPRKNAFGRYVEVHPVGMDSKGVRNGEKWGYLEHGNGGKQDPHPFEDNAVKWSEKECEEAMQAIYDKHVKL